MAAFMKECVCLAALFLHSVLLFNSSVHGLRSEIPNVVYMQNIDFSADANLFFFNHRHQRSYNQRIKRQVVSTQEFQRTIKENETGVVYQIQSQFTEPHRYVLVSDPLDMFNVDQTSGNVLLQPGKRLDYEDDAQRSIELKINATNLNNITAVTEVTLRITVTDVNDVIPEFKNRPYPYLATVGVNTPSDQKVYGLYAEDPDTTSDISYRLDSGADGRFTIRTETETMQSGAVIKVGNIYTQGQGQFEASREYQLTCVAIDNGADPVQTNIASVFVRVGFRPPQFYENPFRGTVRENNRIDQTLNNEFKVEAKGFQDHPLTYELRSASNGTSPQFSIDADGTIKTQQVLDFESVPREQRPPIYELNVFATETATNLQSATKLFIEVLDDNDNNPIFELSRYSATHPEDLPIDSSVLEVKAEDDDSGTNAELTYSIDHSDFYVETVNRTTAGSGPIYVGIVRVKQRLDYDRLPGHVYNFTVTATDKGTPTASGTANVRVFMTNVNDEPPEFQLGDQKLDVREDAEIMDPLTVIQAVDLDKDQVFFYFSPRNTRSEIFEILPSSGLIRLVERVPADRDVFVLNITAVDDGSCCGGTTQLSNETYLVVEVVDVNTNKPSFPDCASYNNATILENQPSNSPVLRVQAVDEDRSENGRVTYSILRPNTQPQIYFNIDTDGGNITSAMQFDRESQSSYSITVQGTDQGVPPLEGYCTFRVSIGDVNDNAPKFDLPSYTATISESYEPGRSIITVRADDDDLGINAEITYLMVDSDGGYFRIEPDVGIIFLNKSLGTQRDYSLRVMARDKGTPPLNTTASVTVRVTDLTSEYPTWNSNDYDQTPYSVDETASVGYIIATFSASSKVTDPDVSFSLMDSDGNNVQSVPPFGISSSGNTVNLTVFSTMNFNVKNRYELRLRVTNRGTIPLSSEINPVIELRDTNNEIPYFRGLDSSTGYYPGSIPENTPPGATVIEIKAYDEDPTSPNNLLTFEIVEKANVSDKFAIQKKDANTAVLTSTATFDREKQSQLFLTIRVKDGTESSRPNHPPGQPNTAEATVRIRITDRNDNSPYFETSYNASVREDASVQQSVLTVSARDPDDAAVLTYSISAGNVRGAFVMQPKTGMISVGRQLDYETEQHIYNLQITVFDGIYSNTTTAVIRVLDANDNSPVFEEDPYVITDVVEEDDSITPTNRRLLVTVTATDADIDRPTNIQYSLLGFGTSSPNKYFEIEPDTGRLYLLTSLDRDLPNGRSNYQFNVRAQDEPNPPPGSNADQPQFGYTSVQVKPIDINDNAPIFTSKMVGSVPEHSERGSSVMTVVAIDYDEGQNGTVKYKIVVGPSDNTDMKFSIRESSGLIQTNTDPDNLDRETTPTYNVVVKASDRGVNPLFTNADVTINLEDINDQIPVFEKQIYKVNMSEAQESGPIARVKATDNDIGENARLDYSLLNDNNHLSHFDVEVVNNQGSIVVYRPVDYEDVSQRFFNLTVVVQDNNPAHTATARVEVTVEDFNDNAPVFVNPRIAVEKYENAEVGTFLAHFSASDADSGINAIFSYSVDRKSDPDRLFSIDENGNVTIRKMMDREKQDKHNIFILAIDKGDPPQTGTATLIVTVLDVNDNFPIFAKDYRPVVMENAEAVPELVVVVDAIDLDNDPFGPPFGFSDTSCTSGQETCPCPGRPTCNDFSLQFLPDGDGGKGNARISTRRQFDREQQKFYYMPIVMWDMRGTGDSRAMTGTNTLTIEIGDINDHVHTPGHQDIFVYNYKGMFGDFQIGSVYATDPDDWDVVNKTFTYTGPKYMASYFSVDKESGMITMAKGVPGNKAHTFTVDVYDRVWKVTAECTVTVTVQDISEEAVFSSGAVRLKGITAEEFVKRPKSPSSDITAYDPSKYDKFRLFIASKLNVPSGNVDVLSVQNKDEFTDVRFSAHGSPYYSPSKMNSIVALNKDSMESQVGVQVEQIPIDECADEMFEGGCYNFLNVTGKPALVNSNGTSFVGVEMFIQATEGCRSDYYPQTDVCSADYCYNGGTCSKDDWGELHCECLPGFNGPRCQGTHHEFNGNSYALYDPLEQCENSRTSLYIITTEDNGLILYNGPTTDRDPNSEEPTDFISLELSAGYPRLRIDHGSGVLELYVDGRDQHGIAKMQRLSDGKWHRIDIVRHGREVEMIVDHCDTADIGQDETARDDKMCRQSGITPDENKFLNVNSLLQLGGRYSAPNYPTGIMPTKFDGCIKELMHNGKMYDLTVPGSSDPNHPSGGNRCTREDVICGENSQDGPVCGDNGICESVWLPQDTYQCVCKPGYMGIQCTESATTKDLGEDSFIQWRLKDSFFNSVNSHKLKMNMMFRTRDLNGVLWTVSSTTNNIAITLQILSGRLTLTYNLGDGIRNLELYNRDVSNGAWHATVVERSGREFILKMDNGEGPNFNFTYGFPSDRQEMLIENTVFAGASVSFSETLPVLESDLQNTCVRDVRMDNEWFPMEVSEDSMSSAATVSKVRNVLNGCVRNDCPNNCPPGLICYPLWGAYECRCPENFEKGSGDICVRIDYCKNHRCFGQSTCSENLENPKKYKCVCPPNWGGEYCDRPIAAPLIGGITTGAIVAIIVSIFVLLVLAVAIILLVKCGRRPSPDDKYILEVDPDDDIRENVINYDEEGAGEEDQDAYDINRLRKPDAESIHKPPMDTMPRRERPLRNAPGESPDVGNFIEDRLGDADDDNDAPPHDSVREYVYEGEGSDAGTLSSLNTTSSSSEQDYDYLNDWGPKFAKLADMYGAGQEPGEEDV